MDDASASTATRPPGRPKGKAPATSAASLLRTAETLLRAEGPDVTLADIAAAAGVTKPLVYHHIGNKDALGRALADRLADRVEAAVEAATAGARSPRDGIARFLEAYLGVVQRDRHILVYVSGGGHGADHVAEALRLADRSAAPIATRFAAFRVDQGADPGVATTWAYAVLGMLHFVTLSWIRDPQLSAAELADQLGELLWTGLRGG